MTKEEIQKSIEDYEHCIVAHKKRIEELKKQLAEFDIFTCRWCREKPEVFGRPYGFYVECSSDDDVCSSAGPTRKTREEAISAWNEMNDTREARIVEKDGNRFAEFTIRARLHPEDCGLIYVHAEAIRFREGGYLPLIGESQILRIEVK